MNPYERFTNRLNGLPVDRPPNFDIMMQFAAHHIGQPLSRYYQDYRVLCAANFAVQRDFDLDILQAISDPYREASDLGLAVQFPEDSLPLSLQPLIQEPADIHKVKYLPPEQGRRMSDRLEAVRLFHSQAGDEVPVMGWVEGALAEAADLRGVATLMQDLVDRPEWVIELLEILVEVESAFAVAQVQAGADIIGLGDAVCSQISPRMYRRFALPYEQRIFAAVRATGAVPRLHICGNTSRILEDMAESGAQIIDLDWMVNFQDLSGIKEQDRSGDMLAPCGNFDPVRIMLQGTPEQVYRATWQCLEQGGKNSFSAAGCEIPDGTPHANLHAQTRALREFQT